MRADVWVLVGLMGWGQAAFGQAAQSRPAKVLTPEQRALQERTRELDAQRKSLVEQAKQVFAAEMEREKAGDCPDARTTVDFNICYGKAADVTDENLKAYEAAIRGVLGLKYPDSPDGKTTGIAGPELSPEQSAAEFDQVEKMWHEYLEAGSAVAFHQFDGGTGGPSFGVETRVRLTRDHLRELHDIYGELWL